MITGKYRFLVTDTLALVVVASLLVALTFWAAFQDQLANRRAKRGASMTVKRGEGTMVELHTVYVATLASGLTLVNATQGLEGNRVLATLVAFGCVTYLFYFSSWFRNAVLVKIKRRVSRD